MKFVADKYQIDRTTPMGKVDEMAKMFDDVIDLSLGDPDLITDDLIIEGAFNDAKDGHTKYTDFRGDPQLRDEISKFYKEEYDFNVKDEEIFVAASGCLSMFLALEAIVNEGEEVIIQAPYFTPYKQQIELVRGVPVELETYEEEDFQINMDRLKSLITDKTKALVINTPSNPTGNCLTRKTMNELSEVIIENDIILIADDIYTAFSYQHPFIPIASLP